jgi:hypothetical protein
MRILWPSTYGQHGDNARRATNHRVLPRGGDNGDRLPGKFSLQHPSLDGACRGTSPEEQAEKVARFVKKTMTEGMNEILNAGLDVGDPGWVPVEVDVGTAGAWGGG